MIEATAAFFGVSAAACRKRYIELGYTEMKGIFVFLDGHYVPPFSYDLCTLEKNQTYVVTREQTRTLIENNPKLARMLTKGRVRFVENHLVIALTVSDMFKFMAMSAAMPPNMELDTGIMRLKVDNGGVFFEINDPYRMRKAKRSSECLGKEPDDDLGDFDDCDDDEEGLLYDGD